MTIYIFCLIEAEGNESGDHGSLFMTGWREGGEQSGHIVSNEDSDV